MSALAWYLSKSRAISISNELRGSGASKWLAVLPAIFQASLRPLHRSEAFDKSALQVIKSVRVRTARHSPHQKETSQKSVGKSGQRQFQAEPHHSSYFTAEEFETYEDKLASTLNQYSSRITANDAETKFTKSLVKELQAAKRHTIRHKHFRPAPFPHLLTWSTKEHIRSLHEEDPEEWSVSALSQRFPVPEEEVKKILKSKRRIFQEEDILRHDKDVLGNWISLHAQLESCAMSEKVFEQFVKCFFNSQNECLITNAVCLSDSDSCRPFSKREKGSKKRGPFSMIVDDCLKIQETETQILLNEKIPSVAHELSLKLEDTTLLFQRLATMRKKGKEIFSSNQDVNTKHASKFDTSSQSTSYLKSNDNKHPIRDTVYVSGKNVLDENGDFLYRIP